MSFFRWWILNIISEQRRLRDDEYPLEVRVILGPHENVARLFLVDKLSTPEISSDVAQFLNLSLAECHGILQRYHHEEERQILLLKEKWVLSFKEGLTTNTYWFDINVIKLHDLISGTRKCVGE